MPEYEPQYDYLATKRQEEPEKEKGDKVLDIFDYPDPILREKAEPLNASEFKGKQGKELKKIIERMFETCDYYGGIGLAAPQIGAASRLFVTTIDHDGSENHRVFINCEILEREGESIERERCLSIPNISVAVPRANKIKVKALDASGQEFELEAEGDLARCIQHEWDHVAPDGGKLIIDYMSEADRTLNDKKMKILQRQYERELKKARGRSKKKKPKRH